MFWQGLPATLHCTSSHPSDCIREEGKLIFLYCFSRFRTKTVLCVVRLWLTGAVHLGNTCERLWNMKQTLQCISWLREKKQNYFLGWFLQLKFSQIKTDCMCSHQYLSIHIYPNVIRTFSFSLLFKEIMSIIYFTLLLYSNEIIVHSGRLCLNF